MFVRIEPKDFSMFSVFFVFNKQAPDVEDPEVQAYLREHGLEPKRQWDEVWQGADCRMLSFGGCYIRDHMGPISEIHRRGVQQTLLRRELEKALDDRRALRVQRAKAAMPPDRLEQVKATVLQRLQGESSFGTDQQGYLVTTVPRAALRREFIKAAAG